MDIIDFISRQFTYTVSHNPMIGMMLLMLIGMSIFLFYLALFYFLFTHTKNPFLKYIFGLFFVSLTKLWPDSKDKKKKK